MEAPKPGTQAPDFKLMDLEGGEHTLAQVTAKGSALLAFVSARVHASRITVAYLRRIKEAKAEVPLIAICQDDEETFREYAKGLVPELRYLNFPALLDPDFAFTKAIGVGFVPTLVWLAKDGVVKDSWSGFRKTELNRLAEAILAEYGGKAAPVIKESDNKGLYEIAEVVPWAGHPAGPPSVWKRS